MTMEPVVTLVMISVLPFITLVVWLVSRKGIPMYGYLQKMCIRDREERLPSETLPTRYSREPKMLMRVSAVSYTHLP